MYREDFIKNYIKGKRVLDLGFTGHAVKGQIPWFHKFIYDHSKFVCGVDIDSVSVKKFEKIADKSKSFYIIDDVLSLKKVESYTKKSGKFDVIVAGELIEHVENPGIFLDNMLRVLSDKGIIIITTPNYICFRNMKSFILSKLENPPYSKYPEFKYGHVIGFTNFLFTNLCVRKGLDIIDRAYFFKKKDKSLFFNLEVFLYTMFPHLHPNMGFVIKRGIKIDKTQFPKKKAIYFE